MNDIIGSLCDLYLYDGKLCHMLDRLFDWSIHLIDFDQFSKSSRRSNLRIGYEPEKYIKYIFNINSLRCFWSYLTDGI